MPRGATQPADHATQPVKAPLNLAAWIKTNAKNLKPPVSNKQLFAESDDMVLFVSGGPNTRNDYHVNPTEELFYQLKGDISVRIRPLDGSPPREVLVREGELFLLPRWVPHRPQRPANTVGLIVEFPRPDGQLDGLRWYCPSCDELVHEVNWRLKKIDEDLAIIMNAFWGGPESIRTCKHCGMVIHKAGAIKVERGRGGTRVVDAPASPTRKPTKKGGKAPAKKPAKSRGGKPQRPTSRAAARR